MKPVGIKDKLYPTEYQRKFETEHSNAEIKKHLVENDKLELTIDGVCDTNCLRLKYREFQESIEINVSKQDDRNRE